MQKSLGALLALFALALAACGGGSGASGGNPFNLAGVVITTPSPTPVPSVTPGATSTPVNVLNDGGFESGAFSATAGWTACSIAHPGPIPTGTATPGAPFPAVAPLNVGAVIVSATSASFQGSATPNPVTTPAILGGKFSALTYSGTTAQTAFPVTGGGKTGPAGANGICQTFAVPAGAQLSMFVNEGGSDSGLNFADQEAELIPTTGANAGVAIPLFLELNALSFVGKAETGGTPAGQTSNAGGTYVMRGPYALTGPPYNLTAGQTVQLFIGSFDSEPSSSFGVYMFVDNVLVTGATAPAAVNRTTSTSNRMPIK
jgi:hypothetical protein